MPSYTRFNIKAISSTLLDITFSHISCESGLLVIGEFLNGSFLVVCAFVYGASPCFTVCMNLMKKNFKNHLFIIRKINITDRMQDL
jgi:hypothetical protein